MHTKFFVGKPREPLGRPRHRWEDNIKMNLMEVGCGLDPSGSGLGPVAGSCEHSNVPSGSTKGRTFLEQLSTLSASQEGLCSMEFVSCLIPGYVKV
jgi:hypothetical protein